MGLFCSSQVNLYLLYIVYFPKNTTTCSICQAVIWKKLLKNGILLIIQLFIGITKPDFLIFFSLHAIWSILKIQIWQYVGVSSQGEVEIARMDFTAVWTFSSLVEMSPDTSFWPGNSHFYPQFGHSIVGYFYLDCLPAVLQIFPI